VPASSTSTITSSAASGTTLLLLAFAAAIGALCNPRVRRVLTFGAVTPRLIFLSPIERPG
jgi:hypothetical protein